MKFCGNLGNWMNWNPEKPAPESRPVPYFELQKGELKFPPAHFADLDGLLAVGGDMTAERLLHAYQSGLYYWHHPMKHIKWWSPDPRTVLTPGEIRISRSLRKTLRRRLFAVTIDRDFDSVIEACAQPRPGGAGLAGILAPGGMAGTRGVLHIGDGPLGDRDPHRPQCSPGGHGG